MGVKWKWRCHHNGNLSTHWFTGLCLVRSYWRLTRGYKLLIITLQLWRRTQELWPSGPSLKKLALFVVQPPRWRGFIVHMCRPSLFILFNGVSLKHPAVCCCLASRVPPTFQFPAAEVQVTIVSWWRGIKLHEYMQHTQDTVICSSIFFYLLL